MKTRFSVIKETSDVKEKKSQSAWKKSKLQGGKLEWKFSTD